MHGSLEFTLELVTSKFTGRLCVQSSCKTHFGQEFLCIPEILTKVACRILLVLRWLFQGRALGEVSIACAR